MSEHQFLQELEKKLWTSANKLLPSLDAAVYKHVVLGMVFLKYVSDSFETRRQELISAFKDPNNDYFLGEDADEAFVNEQLETRDFYTEKNVFWIPQAARWDYLRSNIRLSLGSPLSLGGEFKGAGKLLDDTMELIEKENPKLKRILNKNYATLQIEQSKLADLLDLIATIPFTHHSLKAKDILGHVYEYFLGEFASAEGKKGGQFYTPKSIVNLMVEMIEPYKGRVYDPAMGSGGFFISSEKFIEEHSGAINDLSIFGQESNPTTWRLAAMNMAIRGLDFDFGKEPADTFTNDQHPDLKADFILANPPFNQDEWWDASLEGDARWKYGTPAKGNGNYAWIQHFIHHLAPNGTAGFVLAKGSLTSNTNGEGDIRKALIEANLVDCIVNLPAKLFLNTQIPASIWFVKRNRERSNILFIDARNTGHLISRKTKEFSKEDIEQIASTYHNWKQDKDYEDIKGFCRSVTCKEVAELNYVLTPGRYVGLEESEDEFDFKERFASLSTTLQEQMAEEQSLNERILANLAKIKVDDE